MPTVRYRIRNEYALANPEVYRLANKDDPEALLEGVAMAGLIGVLRLLGDLSEFAAEVFHGLHEEVMATSARGHELMLRVQQLEAEFSSVEEVFICRTDHSHCAYSAGIDWHSNLRVNQNLVTQGDMPRFILDLYQDCRAPPQLLMLDRFDIAGAGACLKRYSDPSYFKTESATFLMMESELQREKRAQKLNKWASHCRSNEAESFLTSTINNSQLTACEQVLEKYPARFVRLKNKNLRVSYISKQSYLEGILKEESLEQNDLVNGSHIMASKCFATDSWDVLNGGVTASSAIRRGFPSLSSRAEAIVKIEGRKAEDEKFFEVKSMPSFVSQKVYPTSGISNQGMMLSGLGSKVGHAFDCRSSETDMCSPAQLLAEQNNRLASHGLILCDDHEGYRSDDIGSEMENYVDALNTLESELETDSESIGKLDPEPAIDGHLEPQAQSSESGFVGSFQKSVKLGKIKDAIHNLSESATLVDLPYQPLQEGTVFEATSSSEINQSEAGKLEKTGEEIKSVPFAYLESNETCFPKNFNATVLVPIRGEASSSSSMSDSIFIPEGDIEEEQLLTAYLSEAFSGNTKNTHEANDHDGPSFMPWQTKHIVVLPTFIDCPDIPTEHSEDKILKKMTDKVDIQYGPSEIEDGTFPGKAPASFFNDSPLGMKDNGRGRALVEQNTNSCPSGSILSAKPLGFTARESKDTSNELGIVMLSGDLASEISSNYMESSNEVNKGLDSSLQFPADTGELPLLISDDIFSTGFMEKSDNFNVNESELSNGSRWKDNFSGGAAAFRMPEPPQEQVEMSILGISTVFEDSLHDSMEDSEGYSVDQLSPKSAAFSQEIVPSILQYESLTTEVKNISLSEEEPVHQQSSASSIDIDVIECEPIISPAIAYELVHSSEAVEAKESSVISMVEPLPSGCVEDPNALQLQPDVFELIETNGKMRCNDSLEFLNESAKLRVQYDELLLEESTNKNDSNAGKVITGDSVHGQVLHMFQSAKISSFDVHSQKDPFSEDDTSYQPNPDIEELAVTRDSTSSLSLNKPFVPFTQDKYLEIFVNAASRGLPSVLDLSNSSDDKLVDINADDIHVELHPRLEGDNMCSREKNQDSDSKYKNVISEDSTNVKVLSSFDGELQEDPISEHKHEIQEPGISSDLTSLKYERKLLVSLSNNRDQVESVDASSSTHLFALDLSNFTDTKLADDNQMKFYQHAYEENFVCSREDEQNFDSKASMQHFQVDAGRLEVQSQQSSVSQVTEEPVTIPSRAAGLNIDSSDIHFHEDCRYQPIYNLKHEGLSKPELLTLCNHELSELSVPSSIVDVTEQTEALLFNPFHDMIDPPGSSIGFVALTSGSPLLSDFFIPNSLTNAQEPLEALADETISRFQIKEAIDEAPPLPPLPPLQWRMAKPQLESLVAGGHIAQPVAKTNPCILPSNTGNKKTSSFVALSAPKETLQQVSSSTFPVMSTTRDGNCQYIYGDCRGYEGEEIQHHNFPGSFSMAAHNIPHYGYHMFVRDDNLSNIYDIMSPEMEGDQPNGKPYSIRNRPRDHLIEAVAAHDKFSMQEVSELDWPLTEPMEDERNYLIEQIKNKSFNLKLATSAKSNMLNAHPTNLKVVAILEKANTIRQACVGSDEDDDNWNDS